MFLFFIIIFFLQVLLFVPAVLFCLVGLDFSQEKSEVAAVQTKHACSLDTIPLTWSFFDMQMNTVTNLLSESVLSVCWVQSQLLLQWHLNMVLVPASQLQLPMLLAQFA
jgi:hypothetical protein